MVIKEEYRYFSNLVICNVTRPRGGGGALSNLLTRI